MYKKFLSITLLVSIGHSLTAMETQDFPILATENNVVENIVIENTIVENNESINVNELVNESESEVAIAPEETIVEPSNDAIEIQNNETQVVEVPAIESPAQEEVVEVNEEVTSIESIEKNEPSTKEIDLDFTISNQAATILNQFSEEAQADFTNFKAAVEKQILELPELKEFITKYEDLYLAYKAFKGQNYKISVDFFVFGDEEINAIKATNIEINNRFKETLSEENKLKFEEYLEELSNVLNKGIEVTLSQMSGCKFPHELIEIDKNKELMFNIKMD